MPSRQVSETSRVRASPLGSAARHRPPAPGCSVSRGPARCPGQRGAAPRFLQRRPQALRKEKSGSHHNPLVVLSAEVPPPGRPAALPPPSRQCPARGTEAAAVPSTWPRAPQRGPRPPRRRPSPAPQPIAARLPCAATPSGQWRPGSQTCSTIARKRRRAPARRGAVASSSASSAPAAVAVPAAAQDGPPCVFRGARRAHAPPSDAATPCVRSALFGKGEPRRRGLARGSLAARKKGAARRGGERGDRQPGRASGGARMRGDRRGGAAACEFPD